MPFLEIARECGISGAAMKAAMQRSSCSVVWPAETCTRMRACPFGTTG